MNINKLKPYRYLGTIPKGSEITINKTGKNTRRTQRTRRIHKNVLDMVLLKMKLHQKSKSTKKICLLTSKNQNTKLPNEGVPTHHHPFQFENYRISYVESPGVHNRKDMVEMLGLPKIDISKLSPKLIVVTVALGS